MCFAKAIRQRALPCGIVHNCAQCGLQCALAEAPVSRESTKLSNHARVGQDAHLLLLQTSFCECAVFVLFFKFQISKMILCMFCFPSFKPILASLNCLWVLQEARSSHKWSQHIEQAWCKRTTLGRVPAPLSRRHLEPNLTKQKRSLI